jgi:anaerobic selenocysteine-containing dehydrogenase
MEINLITARKNNVINGETNIIETKKRSIKIKVKITETIIPNVVAIPHG